MSTEELDWASAPWHTRILIIMVCINLGCFGGIIFGWPPLLLIFQREDQYNELCTVDGCSEQENALNWMYVLGCSVINLCAFPLGILLDMIGPKWLSIMGAGTAAVGFFCMAVSDSATLDYFPLGISLIAITGQLSMLFLYPVSFLLQSKTTILTIGSCCFDASSLVFMLFQLLNEYASISRTILFAVWGGFAFLTFGTLAVLWNGMDKSGTKDTDVYVQDVSKPQQRTKDVLFTKNGKSAKTKTNTFGKQNSALFTEVYSFKFLFAVLYGSVLCFRANTHVAISKKLLENYGDDDHTYVLIFSWILPFGFIAMPAVNILIDKYGLHNTIMGCHFFGVLYNIIAMIPCLELQLVGFVLFSAYRAVSFATLIAFNGNTFSLPNIGKIVGLIFCCAALVNFAAQPCMTVTNAYFNGNLLPVNTILLLLQFVLIAATFKLGK